MSAFPAREPSTAQHDLHDAYRRYLPGSMAAAVLFHVIVIFFFVAPVATPDFTVGAVEPVLIELDLLVPPPPEERTRPAPPVVADEPVDDEITLPPTDIRAVAPDPPVVGVPVDGAAPETTFRFTPFTIKPQCTAGCSGEEILAHVPPVALGAEFSCRLTIGIRIDKSGDVRATDILDSSGNNLCDRAVQEWAATTEWTTAYNRDEPVAVWMALPVEITTE